MKQKINLTEDLLLAKGGERLCYIHPKENDKIVKVLNPSISKHNNQNILEYKYYNFLYSKYSKDALQNIAQCFGFIDTNYGKGLIYERITDYNGDDSKHLRYYLRNHILTEQEEKLLLDELKYFLEKNYILFIDVSTVNLFCRKIKENKYSLVIFDGLGARRNGIKFNMYMKSNLLTKYKIKKQWKKFIENCNRDKLY